MGGCPEEVGLRRSGETLISSLKSERSYFRYVGVRSPRSCPPHDIYMPLSHFVLTTVRIGLFFITGSHSMCFNQQTRGQKPLCLLSTNYSQLWYSWDFHCVVFVNSVASSVSGSLLFLNNSHNHMVLTILLNLFQNCSQC